MKKFICLVVCLALVLAIGAPAMAAGEDESYRIGVTFYDLSNPIWAATGEEMISYGQEFGIEITLVGAENNAATQVTQMENFIESGVDMIVVGAVDDNSLTDVIARAKEAGVLVMAYGTEPVGCDAYYVVDNYNVGVECGTRAGEWINDKLGGEAEVGILDFPSMEVLIARADGIIAGIEETAPNAKIVATQAAADAVTGLNVTENILQENPNIKVIACIGDGGGIGANNAVKAADLATDDFGIFSVDATEEAVMSIKAGDPLRMSVGLGTEVQKAHQVIDIAMQMLNGEEFEEYSYTPVEPVDIDNCDAYIEAAGWGA